jgi:LuxR family maltose regulon positive regulatory protein
MMHKVRSTSDQRDRNRRLAWGLPPSPSTLLERRRFHPQLGTAMQGRVVVVTGPPGSGKSALVSGWVGCADPADVAWLTLSADDVGYRSLWDWVADDLDEITRGASRKPSAGTDPAALGRKPDRTKPAEDKQVLLVIDNIDLLTRSESAAEFDNFLQTLNETVGLVLIGRHWGELALHRLGMQRGLTEIDGVDLAFSDHETAELLSACGVTGIPDGDLEELSSRLEGWAAGVRLTSITLAAIADSSDAPNCVRTGVGLIADYFRKEVFEAQPDDVRAFLCRTAILDVLQPDLCNALTGRHDSLVVLENLTRQNLFVGSTERPGEFRYHSLYREFLCHELALDDVDVERDARLTAAWWLDEQGDRLGAIRQLDHAGCYDELFNLAVKSIQRGVGLRFPPTPDTMLPAGLPASYFEGSPDRMYPLCVSMLLRSDLDGAAKWLRRWESAIGGGTGSALQRARCELIWAIYDFASINPDDALRHLESIGPITDSENLRLSPASVDEEASWARELDAALLATTPMLTARADLWLGKPERSKRVLLDSYGMDHADSDPFLANSLAVVLVAAGHIRQAEELATRALAHAEADGGLEAAVTLDSRLALARVLYERDDLPGAEAHLRAADLICRSNGLERWSSLLECELARLDLARGRAREALRRLEALRRNEPLNEVVSLREGPRELEVRCRIILGDLLGAEDLLGDWPGPGPAPELVARFSLAAGRPDRASAVLSRPLEPPSVVAAIERLLLQTRVHLQTGNRRAAEHSLQRAVNLAKPEGFVRVFLDEPAQIGELLGSLGTEDADSFVHNLRDKHIRRGQPQQEPAMLLIEPLTDRERELLGYLPCHLSQSEIARQMFISANTVKTHMKGLYRKLGARSRSQAVSIASRCGMLDQLQSA